jgi:hypothetical protein
VSLRDRELGEEVACLDTIADVDVAAWRIPPPHEVLPKHAGESRFPNRLTLW